MTFPRIDWPEYNEPPYFPQWLAKGETLDLARYGDELRRDVEKQIVLMSDQFDLNTANRALLDRMGKILSEPRNGYDNDMYRRLLLLRILLNTTNGSVNDIIAVIKFLYSSEIVHITPRYPAGISIKRDGENSNMDFNRLVRAVVPAGVDYNTTEMFAFLDNQAVSDVQNTVVQIDIKETVKISDKFSAFSSGNQSSDMATDSAALDDSISAGMRYHNFRDGRIRRDGSVRRNSMLLIPLEFKQQ